MRYAAGENTPGDERLRELEPTEVHASLRWLSAANPAVFGADQHRFRLNPPLPEEEVSSFERKHRVRLPADYRDFVAAVGNGGAGPYYGVFPLGKMDGASGQLESWQEDNGFIGTLSEPFPLRESWNDLTGMPSEELGHDNEQEYWNRLEGFEKKYWASSRMNGAIPICHEGCALRVWLVVSGSEAGRLWHDGRADYTGLRPVLLKNGTPATFASWYREWLYAALDYVSASSSSAQ